jgi:phosphoglycolate phosphatase-like HAD superfamily hydrolase
VTDAGSATDVIGRYAIVFWDFDGVIKESVAAKGEAFAQLFRSFGGELVRQVREHHERNGGMSRFEKIPLYLRWAGITPDEREVSRYCEAFATAVRSAVLESQWVPGAQQYLQNQCRRQRFVLLSATPQAEIEEILATLGVRNWFSEVFGTPTTKTAGLSGVLQTSGCEPAQALLIGDSEADYRAAMATGVDFLLRRTPFNQSLQATYSGPQCENFLHE